MPVARMGPVLHRPALEERPVAVHARPLAGDKSLHLFHDVPRGWIKFLIGSEVCAMEQLLLDVEREHRNVGSHIGIAAIVYLEHPVLHEHVFSRLSCTHKLIDPRLRCSRFSPPPPEPFGALRHIHRPRHYMSMG